MPNALITGASAGLGRAIATELVIAGWTVVITARGAERLNQVAAELSAITASSMTTSARTTSARTTSARTIVEAIAGDVSDPHHRAELVAAVGRIGSLDLLVNNASTLGPTPLRPLATLSAADLTDVLGVNLTAPFDLTAALLPLLVKANGVVINISSDAAVEHYPQWGAYGASKAALDHLTLTFAEENPEIHCYTLDPGDMRTDMQQAAFPGEDISDRRPPAEVVPALIDLVTHRPPSGRYRAGDGVALADRTAEMSS